jgi:hypothetical protein
LVHLVKREMMDLKEIEDFLENQVLQESMVHKAQEENQARRDYQVNQVQEVVTVIMGLLVLLVRKVIEDRKDYRVCLVVMVLKVNQVEMELQEHKV